MIWTILALWLTFQLGAIIGYLLHDYGPKPRRKLPTPPKPDLRWLPIQRGWSDPRPVDEAA